MKKLICGLVAVLVIACSSSSPAASQKSADPAIVVTLSPDDEGLIASWLLPTAVDEFFFDAARMSARQRLEDWKLLSNDWDFDGASLRRTDKHKFTTFSFLLTPSTRFYDRQYVPLSKVGNQGFAIYAGALAPAGENFKIGISEFEEDSTLVGSGKLLTADGDVDGTTGIFFVGPESYVHSTSPIVIAGPEFPQWLRNEISSQIEDAIHILGSRFRERPAEVPTVILSYNSEPDRRTFRGSVIKSTVAFYINGFQNLSADDPIISKIKNTAVHETVHLWNGSIYRSTNATEQPWLHEGSAEYIANRLWMSESQFIRTANQSLNSCLVGLGGKSLEQSPVSNRGRIPYHCGFVIHLIAEVSAAEMSGNDILDVWSALFERAANEDNEYDAELFLQIIENFGGQEAAETIRQLLHGTDSDSKVLYSNLERIGLHVEPMSSTEATNAGFDLPVLVLKNLLAGYCHGGRGFWRESDNFRLNTGDRCGPILSGNHRVTGINGHSFFESGSDVYSVVYELCEDQKLLEIDVLGAKSLPGLECPNELQSLPKLVKLKHVPPLPDLTKARPNVE